MKKSKFRISGLLRKSSKLHFRAISLTGESILLNTKVKDTILSFVPMHWEENHWANNPYRMDNSHHEEPLHVHWLGEVYPATHLITIKDVLLSILGTQFNEKDFLTDGEK
ncbi:MAG: hypothetical protein AABX59_00385 [Nanoarchaeota archaeon]